MTLSLTTLIRLAGVMHFGILVAAALTPRVLDWKHELGKLERTSRDVIWVHALFIMLTILMFGLICLTCGAELARNPHGSAAAICVLIGNFWFLRLIMQLVLFTPGPLLSTPMLKVGYHGLTVVFIYMTAVFSYAALRPGM